MPTDVPGSPRPLPGLSQVRDLLASEQGTSSDDEAAAPLEIEQVFLDAVEHPAIEDRATDPGAVKLEAPREWVDRRAEAAAGEPEADAPKPTLRARLGRLFGRRG